MSTINAPNALEIEARAKRRLADEYDAAQERGAVATRQRNSGSIGHVPEQNTPPATVSDLGPMRKDIHEARQERDAEQKDPGIVRHVLDRCLNRGEEPLKIVVKMP